MFSYRKLFSQKYTDTCDDVNFYSALAVNADYSNAIGYVYNSALYLTATEGKQIDDDLTFIELLSYFPESSSTRYAGSQYSAVSRGIYRETIIEKTTNWALALSFKLNALGTSGSNLTLSGNSKLSIVWGEFYLLISATDSYSVSPSCTVSVYRKNVLQESFSNAVNTWTDLYIEARHNEIKLKINGSEKNYAFGLADGVLNRYRIDGTAIEYDCSSKEVILTLSASIRPANTDGFSSTLPGGLSRGFGIASIDSICFMGNASMGQIELLKESL